MLNMAEYRTAIGNLIERPDSAFVTKIDEFINERYRSIVGLRPWMALLRQLTLPTVAGLDYIITHQEVDQIIDISQRSTPTILALQRYYNILQRNIDSITQGDVPTKAAPMGEIGVKEALPSAGTISIVSSSSSDTTQNVRVRGYNASKLPIQELVSLNGVTPAVTTLSYSHEEGYEPRFSKDSDTVGYITITRGAVTICELSQDAKEARYKKWKIWPVPISAVTMYVTYKKKIYKLEQAEDVPELECDNLLILGSYARALEEKRQMAKAAKIWGSVDANGEYPPGSYKAELEALIAREPQFQDGFQEQIIPLILRDDIDNPQGGTGFQLRPSGS